MKKYIYLILLLLLSYSVAAKDSTSIANDFYKKGQYEEAIKAYKELMPVGYESSELYYNIANAYYKNDQIAKAILYYEKALLIQPNFDDARINLELAQTKIVDKIDVEAFFLNRWIDNFSNMRSSNAWAIISIVVFIFCLIFIFIYAFSKIVLVRKISFYSAIVLLLVCITSMSMAKKQKDKIEKREYAIIMSSSVTVKSSPDDNGTTVFVLHEGTKVKIKKTPDVWVEIILEDGNVGWMLSEDVEII